jgi:hypothetical protein
MRPLVVTGVTLFTSGFLADPAWIISYPKMLLGYQGEGNVSTCSECASLPVWISRWLFDGSLSNAMKIAVLLLIVSAVLFYLTRSTWRSHEYLLSAALLTTTLVSPYLYNYDFLLLLVPFAVLSRNSSMLQKVLIALFYLVPTVMLLTFGRSGNISLIVASSILLLMLYMQAKTISFKVENESTNRR